MFSYGGDLLLDALSNVYSLENQALLGLCIAIGRGDPSFFCSVLWINSLTELLGPPLSSTLHV